MMLSDDAFASLKEFKLSSFESLLKKKKKSQANLEWHSRACCRKLARLQAVCSKSPGSEKIADNCFFSTLCALLNFELHFFLL